MQYFSHQLIMRERFILIEATTPDASDDEIQPGNGRASRHFREFRKSSFSAAISEYRLSDAKLACEDRAAGRKAKNSDVQQLPLSLRVEPDTELLFRSTAIERGFGFKRG
jgi:hypothetical protein